MDQVNFSIKRVLTLLVTPYSTSRFVNFPPSPSRHDFAPSGTQSAIDMNRDKK